MSEAPHLLTRFGDVNYAFCKPAGMAVHQNAEGGAAHRSLVGAGGLNR
jgi:hypothetical protein